MSTTHPTHCPRCGGSLGDDSPRGLCPQCLLQQGLASATDVMSDRERSFVALDLESVRTRFPQLELLSMLGRGGMGVVYKARQPGLQREVAVKVLPIDKDQDPGFAERFVREARALAQLNHPNIITIYEFGEQDGLYHFVMEFVDGVNLRELIRQGRLPAEEALAIVPQICDALQYAHDEGVVHRDIKPENILLDSKGRVKIADFGLVKLLGTDEPERQHMTGSRMVMGTPHYMAPEQVETPLAVDHRADIYALGVVFYEMLTGELPLGRFAPPSEKVQVTVALDEVVLRALEREPERRYQQISEVKTRVESLGTGVRTAAPDEEVPSQAPTLIERTPDAPEAPQGPPTGGRLVMLIVGANVCVLLMLGGLALAFGASVSNPKRVWAFYSAAFGLFFGGAGGLMGVWASFRQWSARKDTWEERPGIWLDWTFIAYGALGAALAVYGAESDAYHSAQGALTLGTILLFQCALFLAVRVTKTRRYALGATLLALLAVGAGVGSIVSGGIYWHLVTNRARGWTHDWYEAESPFERTVDGPRLTEQGERA